jgi:hypothetical protein
VRWLLLKDLQILRRSPFIVALLIAYPVAMGLLIGFALSRDEGKPRVAFVSEVPPEAGGFDLGPGEEEFGTADARAELCHRVECVDADSRADAQRMVERGEVLGALILPPDMLDRLRSLAGLVPEQPRVDVLVNEDDPVKAQLVDDRIQALVTEANLILSQRVSEQVVTYIDLLTDGGELDLPLLDQPFEILGLERAERRLRSVREEIPQGSPARDLLDSVIDFARLARENLAVAVPLLGAVAEPIAVSKTVVAGDAPALDAFAIAIAVTITLMFVTVLLVAGSLALEREENVFTRITRGSVGRGGLLGEKVALGVIASVAVAAVMLGVLTLIVTIAWARAPLIGVAILGSGLAFAAFGAAIGSAAREVRASSLLAFMVALPVAFLSLIPAGVVGTTLFDVVRVVRGLFPFAPSLDAVSGGLDPGGPAIGLPLLHLLALGAAYGLLARLGLRRFA